MKAEKQELQNSRKLRKLRKAEQQEKQNAEKQRRKSKETIKAEKQPTKIANQAQISVPKWRYVTINLVCGFTPSEKYEFVNWDDDIPNIIYIYRGK